jgi:hypothetical protein
MSLPQSNHTAAPPFLELVQIASSGGQLDMIPGMARRLDRLNEDDLTKCIETAVGELLSSHQARILATVIREYVLR